MGQERRTFSTEKLNVLAMSLALLSRSTLHSYPPLFRLLLLLTSTLLTHSLPLQLQLLQIQKQYKLIKPGSSVLDLGCAPGAWLQVDISSIPSFELCERKLILDFYCYDSLQVACQSLGPLKNGGTVVGMDIKVIRSFI